MKESKKRLKNEYKQTPLTMGVFLIRNIVNDKVFLGVGQDLHGIINRHKFQLKTDSHPNKALQADWNELGTRSFAFEILEELRPPGDPGFDLRRELAFLEELWLERLQPFGDHGYNEPRLSKEEKLRRIAARRLDSSNAADAANQDSSGTK